jgi:uncharacterized alkaline shock family protein YloU
MENADVKPDAHEDHGAFGEIKINHSVVASIVRLAALDVPGVCAVGYGFVDQIGGSIGGIFSKRESDRGVKVQEDPEGGYIIEIRLVMAYGSELGKTAHNVQLAIRNQIHTMTGKEVSRVDVIIDGVKAKEDKKKESAPASQQWVDSPKTD